MTSSFDLLEKHHQLLDADSAFLDFVSLHGPSFAQRVFFLYLVEILVDSVQLNLPGFVVHVSLKNLVFFSLFQVEF